MDSQVERLMARCSTKAGEVISASKRPKDISKFVFERYSNAKTYTLKLFLYSSGSTNNNTPYTFDTPLTKNTKDAMEDMLVRVFEVNDTNLDDLLGTEPITTDDMVVVEDVIEEVATQPVENEPITTTKITDDGDGSNSKEPVIDVKLDADTKAFTCKKCKAKNIDVVGSKVICSGCSQKHRVEIKPENGDW